MTNKSLISSDPNRQDISFDRTNFIKILLDAGAIMSEDAIILLVNFPERFGSEARYLVDAALRGGADPNSKDVNDVSALHVSTDVSISALLIENGAVLNAQDENGNTPFDYVLFKKNVRIGYNKNVRIGYNAVEHDISAHVAERALFFLERGAEYRSPKTAETAACALCVLCCASELAPGFDAVSKAVDRCLENFDYEAVVDAYYRPVDQDIDPDGCSYCVEEDYKLNLERERTELKTFLENHLRERKLKDIDDDIYITV